MLHAEARRNARRTAAGDYVPLDEQDPAGWNQPLIDEAEALLFRASAKGEIGRFQLEAAVQSAHVERRVTGKTNWEAIERLYDALFALTGSPVVAINRAVAIAETRGAGGGRWPTLDLLAADPASCRIPALLGRPGRTFSRGPATRPPPLTPSSLRSAWSPTPPSAASCRTAARRSSKPGLCPPELPAFENLEVTTASIDGP